MTICRAYPLRGGAGVGILVGEGDYRGGMAVYRKLTWEDMPRIRFAHAHATARYDMAFPAMPRWLEFAYFEQGAVVRRLADGTRQPIPQGSAGLFTFRQASRFYSPAPACRHITVGFEAAYRMEEISREELLAGTRLEEARPPAVFLPAGAFPLEEKGPAAGTLRRLIALYALPEAAQRLRCTALLFELLAALTEETVRAAVLEEGSLSPSGILYARRACRYIAAHLSEKITMAALAAELGISTSYLSALFKAYTGRSVVDYVNARRVERVRELLATKGGPLREAGESVGLADENYVGRLFKRYTGQSVRDFQRQCQARNAGSGPESPENE